MKVTPTGLPEVVLIEPDCFEDERGYFFEAFQRERFADLGLPWDFVQDNQSRSRKDVLRGIHYQDDNAPMGKLVRCLQGAILDVAVDLRSGSPTFGQHVAQELTADNRLQMWIPQGFGHAFLALTDAEVFYKCTGYYVPTAEGTALWNDSDLAIDWPIRQPILSERDRNGETARKASARLWYRIPAGVR